MSPKYVDCTSVYWRGLQETLVVPSLRHWLSVSGLCSTVRASSGFQKSYLSPSSFWLMFKVLLSNCDFHTQSRLLQATSLIDGTVNQPLCEEMEAQPRARLFTKYKIQGEENRDGSVGKVLATQAQDPTLDPLYPCEHKQALCNNEHLRFQH